MEITDMPIRVESTTRIQPLAEDIFKDIAYTVTGVAFKLTALPDRLEIVEQHMRRFLHHTNLRAIQWANLFRKDIQFTTLLHEQ